MRITKKARTLRSPMTSSEYRAILNGMTLERRIRLIDSGGVHHQGSDIDNLVSEFEELHPDNHYEKRIVVWLQRNVPGCGAQTEEDRIAQATYDSAWYAWAAFWSATVIGLAGLAATIYFGLR